MTGFLLAAQVVVALTPGQTLSATCSGQLSVTQTSPSLAARCDRASVGGAIIVDHTSIALFSRMPAQYETAARALRLQMGDRSVGQNIFWGLMCLEMDYSVAGAPCTSVAPGQPLETWSRPYAKPNWTYWFEPNQGPDPNTRMVSPLFNGLWTGLQPGWMDWLASKSGQFDVVSFQMNYLFGLWSPDPIVNYFTDRAGSDDIYDFETFANTISPVRVVYWTSSLPQGDAATVARLAAFNASMRTWVRNQGQGRILIDFADIESHRPDGTACVDSGDNPIVCSEYSNDGGHLAYGPGKVRAAKAVWVAMSQLAGWRP